MPQAPPPFSLAKLPPDLERVRAQLGEALFAARVADARNIERQLIRMRALVEQGHAVPAAAKLAAETLSPVTLKGLRSRWRREGLAALINRRCGRSRTRALRGATPFTLTRRVGRSSAHRPHGLLRMPGSKTRLLPQLAAHLPARFERFIEPFVGGGALFFHLRPARAVLIDRNAEFINLYEVTRENPGGLAKACTRHPPGPEHYYRVRGLHPDELDPIARAARTLFLNRTGFNGLFRVNSHGLFNVPYGDGHNCFPLAEETLLRASTALRAAKLLHADFSECLRHARAKDFVYLDPPYDVPLGRQKLKYQRGGFSEGDQRRVADVMRELDERGCFVLASNSDTPLVRRLYRGFKLSSLVVARQVGGLQSTRARVGELLIRNYPLRE